MQTTGEKIKELRKSKNISQEELSFELGVSRQTIHKWENDTVQPNMDNIVALCTYFKINSDYFFSSNPENDNSELAISVADNSKIDSKRKKVYITCVALLVIFIISFIISAIFTLWSGMVSFSSNTGHVKVTNMDVDIGVFIGCLIWCLISLCVFVSLIFIKKKFKK